MYSCMALDAMWNDDSVSAARMMRSVRIREAIAEPWTDGIGRSVKPEAKAA
jgi:hypothetical protein